MKTKQLWLTVIPAVCALTLTACSSGSSSQSGQASQSDQSSTSAGGGDAYVRLAGAEPQNPLIPANTTEVGGGQLVDMLYSGLVYYDKEGKVHNEVAESIETTDKQNYTVKLKKGWKFSDGTDVKAHNFTDAWKLATSKSMGGAEFFSPIEGTNDDGSGDLSGVKEVDDYTFTIKLKQPTSDFLQRLGYNAFYPLSDSTIKDPVEGGEHPVTDGPYMPAGKDAWQHRSKFTAIPNPDYSGERKPKNAGIEVIFYAKPDAAYRDLQADQLDIGGVPSQQLSTYKSDFPGHILERASTNSSSLSIPEYLKHFSGEEGKLRRRAISHAINREEITGKIFKGIQVPAKEFTSPQTPGYNDHLKGNDVLTYDPQKAKDLWNQANAISPWDGQFTIAYNADGGNQSWVDATASSIKNTLGIDAEGKSYVDFKSLLDDIKAKKLTGATRAGWQADYPSQINYMAPLYKTNAGSNSAAYSNPEFDKLLSKAQLAPTDEEFNKTLNQAQEILFEDLPVIPLWNGKQIVVWSNKITSFNVLWNGELEFWSIQK